VLQGDGKLVAVLRRYVSPTRAIERIQWRAPGDPDVHELALPVVEDADPAGQGWPSVAIAGDRIVARTRAADGSQQLVVSDLAGSATPLVTLGPDTAIRPAAQPLGFAFDGQRLAWAVVQCERVTIGLSAAGDPPATVAHDVCARPRVVTPGAHVDAAGRFTLGMTCRRGCHGRMTVDVARGGPSAARFRFGPSEAVRHVTLRLTRATRRLRGTLHARARFDGVNDLGGDVVVLRR
jgi:hypothetical protein